MPTSPRRFRANDPALIPATAWNRAADRLEALARAQAAPPLAIDGGRQLRDTSPRGFWAALSGTHPYSWQEKVRSGGAWVDGPRSGTSSAVELNATSGLSGKIVWLEPCAPGEWCFQYVKKGTTATGTFNVTVRGCGSALLPGATVEVKSGATVVGSGTTNASGFVAIAVPAGTYTIEATKPPEFQLSTGSHAVTAGGTTTVDRTLTAAAGYSCSTPSCCPEPFPTTLTVTDSTFGATTLTYDPAQFFWVGCKNVPSSLCYTPGGSGSFATCTGPAGGSVAIHYRFACGSNTVWILHWRLSACIQGSFIDPNTSNNYLRAQSCPPSGLERQIVLSNTVDPSECDPVNVAFSHAVALGGGQANDAFVDLYGVGTVNFTVTE